MTTKTLEKQPILRDVTDTVEGEYVSVFDDGLGFDLKPGSGMRKTLRKVVCFKRASDGALEPAWATPSYYTSEGLERRLTAQCNISLGRLRRHLARTGQRWEVEQDRERKAKKAKAEAELAARNAKRAAAEALFDALERLLLAVEHDKVPGIGFATDPARAALALAKTIPAKR